MKTDNQWHPGVCIKGPDGDFYLFDTLEEAEVEATKKGWSGEIKYSDCRVNYNRGQPLVDIDGMMVSIVDTVWKKEPGQRAEVDGTGAFRVEEKP